jgi:hypothetical protein
MIVGMLTCSLLAIPDTAFRGLLLIIIANCAPFASILFALILETKKKKKK